MSKTLDFAEIDSLTAVELPDRNLLDSCGNCFFVIWIDAFNNWSVFSDNYDSFNTQINDCYAYGGSITQMGYNDPSNTIDPSNDPTNTVTSTTGAIANFPTFTDTSTITDPNTIIQEAQANGDNTVVCSNAINPAPGM
jgi:hypothetical protein